MDYWTVILLGNQTSSSQDSRLLEANYQKCGTAGALFAGASTGNAVALAGFSGMAAV